MMPLGDAFRPATGVKVTLTPGPVEVAANSKAQHQWVYHQMSPNHLFSHMLYHRLYKSISNQET